MTQDAVLRTRILGAFLFDMDGTLLSSIAAAERVWTAWAVRHGLDVARFLPTIHGVRAVETIRRLALPGVSTPRRRRPPSRRPRSPMSRASSRSPAQLRSWHRSPRIAAPS